MQKYFGIRAEWVDEVEILRRISIGIYDHDEYEKALAWVRENCKEGFDKNLGKNLPPVITKSKIVPADKDWEFIVKMTLIIRDILYGNPRRTRWAGMKKRSVATLWSAASRASASGQTGYRTLTSPKPSWLLPLTGTARRPSTPFATENDTCNGIAMMLGSLVSGSAPCFHDVYYWSPSSRACDRAEA